MKRGSKKLRYIRTVQKAYGFFQQCDFFFVTVLYVRWCPLHVLKENLAWKKRFADVMGKRKNPNFYQNITFL